MRILSFLFILLVFSFTACRNVEETNSTTYKKYLDKVQTCPECGGKDITIAVSASEGSIYQRVPAGVTYVCKRVSVVCKKCGLVIKEYAEEPEDLK